LDDDDDDDDDAFVVDVVDMGESSRSSFLELVMLVEVDVKVENIMTPDGRLVLTKIMADEEEDGDDDDDDTDDRKLPLKKQ
jgi:hypothetical protein